MRWPFTFFTRFSTLIYRKKYKYIFDGKVRKKGSKILVDLVYTYIQGFSLTSFKNKIKTSEGKNLMLRIQGPPCYADLRNNLTALRYFVVVIFCGERTLIEKSINL